MTHPARGADDGLGSARRVLSNCESYEYEQILDALRATIEAYDELVAHTLHVQARNEQLLATLRAVRRTLEGTRGLEAGT